MQTLATPSQITNAAYLTQLLNNYTKIFQKNMLVNIRSDELEIKNFLQKILHIYTITTR